MARRKRNSASVFDAVQELESQDARAERKRRRRTSTNVAQATAAKSQTKLHGRLMECRILLQRVIGSSLQDEEEESGDVREACNGLLVQLLEARSQLSSSEEESSRPDYREIIQSDEALSNTLQSEYEEYRHEWKRVLNQRHKDLRLHAGLTAKSQFKVMDSNFWQQVDSTVNHEELRMRAREEDGNPAQFDDSKVYQHMLQDFVLTSSGAGAEEAAAQRLRRAMKNSKKTEVDRKASKGRKIRYTVIPKLVNFTFPVARPALTSSGMDEDEWFRSLFGGAGNQKR